MNIRELAEITNRVAHESMAKRYGMSEENVKDLPTDVLADYWIDEDIRHRNRVYEFLSSNEKYTIAEGLPIRLPRPQ